MLTQILDQWEVLAELQRQQNTWQQRWDHAQAEFQRALQQLDPRDADRLARVLAESLPTPLQISSPTPTSPLVGSLSYNGRDPNSVTSAPPQPRPSDTQKPAKSAAAPTPATQPTTQPVNVRDLAAQAAAVPPTAHSNTTTDQTTAVDTKRTGQFPTPSSTPSSTESPAVRREPNPNPRAAASPDPAVEITAPLIDEAAIFASDDAFYGSTAPDETPTLPNAAQQAQATTSNPATEPTPAQRDLLQWATDTIGDGVTENELFQAMRKSPFAGQARQLLELLRERDALYETDDEVIHVHSLKKIAEFQNT